MKKILITLVALTSAALAKQEAPKCESVARVKEEFTPQFLAVVDGYDKSGKKIEEVDIGEIVSDASTVQKDCSKNKTSSLKSVHENAAKDRAKSTASTVAVSPDKMLCKDFVSLDDVYRPVVAYWVAGYSKAGAIKSGNFENVYLEEPVAALVEECIATPRSSFLEKSKAWARKHF